MTFCLSRPEAETALDEIQATAPQRGRLALGFARAPDDRTFVKEQFASYPFHICRPFHVDKGAARGMATLYLQSCSGGLYSGEHLSTEIHLEPGAEAHITTQASTIVHRGTYGAAEQMTHIRVASKARLEYLPDPVILFPGAKLQSSLKVELSENASAILSDSFLAHDFRADGGVFDRFDNEICICTADGAPRVLDRFRITGSEFANGGIGRMGHHACHGSVIAVAPGVETDLLIARARAAIAGQVAAEIGISRLPNLHGFSARILSRDAVAMKAATTELWAVTRHALTGQTPEPRRK